MRKYILTLLSIAIFLSACVKERDTFDFTDNTSRPVVEFAQGGKFNINTLGVNITPGISEVDLAELRFATRSIVSKNTEVTIQLNPALVSEYNDSMQTAFTIPAPAIYSFNTQVYTLSPEGRSIQVKISLDAAALQGNEYALGFTIVESTNSDVGLKKDYIVTLKAKNIYDGEYTSNGYFYHPTLPRELVDLPKTLTTVSATAVSCDLGDLGGSGYIAIFDVDAANNVTITDLPGAVGGPYTMFTTALPSTTPGYTPQWPRSAECNNTYDPATKEFKVRYGYMGASGWRVTEEVIRRN